MKTHVKGEVQSRKILPLLKEFFLRNWEIIAGFSSLPFNCDDSALKLLLFTTFASRKCYLRYDVSYEVAIVKPCSTLNNLSAKYFL